MTSVNSVVKKLPRVAFATLGCRVNQWDSQALREQMEGGAFEVVPWGAPADVAVVNSCTVTAAADADARRLVRQARRRNPGAFVVLTGCLAQDRPPEAEAFGADLVVGNEGKARLLARILEAWEDARTFDLPHPPDLPETPWGGGISRFDGRRRAVLKVQEGCRFACSFCRVPRVRGPLQSRPAEEILGEARRLVDSGAREVVLAGIQLSSYGLDLGLPARAPRLAPVVEGILRVPGIRRVRLSSYSAADFEDALLALLGWDRGLCPHFHLPLQSGDPSVLRAMRRPYTLEGFRHVVEKIRRAAPKAGLTTDLIAGFPGETDDAFRNTLAVIEEIGFLDLHPFPYSDRPGTEAGSRYERVDPALVRERMAALLEVKAACVRAAAAVRAGAEFETVAERRAGRRFGALTPEGLRACFEGRGAAGRPASGRHTPNASFQEETGAVVGDEVRLRLTGASVGATALAERIA